MAEPKLHEWQVPPQASDTERRLRWLDEATEDGQAWLKSQRGTYDWKRAMDVVGGRLLKPVPEYRSQVNTNHLKRNMREIIGTLSRLRPIWGYNSDNTAFKANAEVMNKLNRAIYLEQFFDRSIQESLAWAATTCTGWIWPVYARGMAGRDRGNISLRSLGAPCVLPSQLPSSGNFQQAYAVTILDEMPVYMAHGMFPRFQEQLKPTSSTYWHSADIRAASRGNIWKWFSMSFKGNNSPSERLDTMVPIRYTYVIDLALNETKCMIPMGEPDTPWYYEVPALGEPMQLRDGKTRVATENDARLYPYRRLMISSETCLIYDGPSSDWHGMLPLAQFALDKWPWEPLGYSLVRDGYDIQTAICDIERGVIDRVVAQNDLPLSYDINSMSPAQAKQLDPMQPRSRTGYDMSSGTSPFQPAVPLEVYKVAPEQFTMLDHLKTSMDEQHAIKDMYALAEARMAGDDVAKIMEANGPIITDMSRSMEPPMRDIGNMVKYLILEYFTTSRVMQYVGADGITPETFDFAPDQLIPSHLPGEDTSKPSLQSNGHRAHVLADNLRFFITPNSLHEMQQMEMKLGLIQLRKALVPIDSETIAEAWGIRNFGTIPGATVIDKYYAEQERQLEQAARMKTLAAGMEALGPVAALIASAKPPGAAIPGHGSEGQPPSGHAAPSLINKSDGRTIITESHGGGKVV
jgi:hypothetical protein